jgi:hypothetical protein
LQIDGISHHGFEGRGTCLHPAGYVDDATSRLMHLHFRRPSRPSAIPGDACTSEGIASRWHSAAPQRVFYVKKRAETAGSTSTGEQENRLVPAPGPAV